MTSSVNTWHKFLLLTSYSLPDTAGSGIHAFRFARFIVRKGDKATILTFNRNCRYHSKEIIENVPIYRIPYFNKGLFMKLLSLPIVIFYYIKYVVKNEIVFIYGGKIIAWELVIILTCLLHKKIVFRSLLEGVDDMNNLIGNKPVIIQQIIKVIVKHIDIYYSINQYFTDQYKIILKTDKKILELPQGVDDTEFFPVTREKKMELRKIFKLPINIPIIISIGFVIKRKGYLEIFSQLQNLDFEYRYIVLGEYDLPANHFLSQHKDEMNGIFQNGRDFLADRVIFFGHRSDVVKFLQCSDYFLMNSVKEGLPNVILEAMACEIPVVTRNLKGVSKFITRHSINAMIFDSPEEIPLIVNHLYKNPELSKQVTLNARKDIVEKYSFAKIYPQLLEKLS